MKWVRQLRLTGQVFAARPISGRLRPCDVQRQCLISRSQSTTASLSPSPSGASDATYSASDDHYSTLTSLPSPPPSAAETSAKLSALHARLSLSSKVPLTTLSRTLIDQTADDSPRFNNSSLAELGNHILGYYCGEHLVAHYPRLPTAVLQAGTYAYVGPEALATVVREWGVEVAAEPGGEVDPGLLQFRHIPPERYQSEASRNSGATPPPSSSSADTEAQSSDKPATTYTRASTSFFRALIGALYLHTGRQTTKQFVAAHILSRHLSLPKLFSFRQPTRDLSRLCAREGFASPIARIISSTGRKSRTPVYVVGVYSGEDKLGEGQGGSLNEARTRAAVNALMGWYLYSPEQVTVPSLTEDEGGTARWRPAMIDGGEIVV